MNAKQFVEHYLDAEYDLWTLAHTEPDDDRFFRTAQAFEDKYFGPDLYSDISRPGQMDHERFQAFRQLLSAKHKRTLYDIREDEGGVTSAVLGSIDAGSTQRFELIRIRELDGALKIVSSYLTNFDGTFGYSGGEDVGEDLPDLH